MPETLKSHHPYRDRTRNPVATPEQQRVMYAAMDWFNISLWMPQGALARTWLAQYGITPEYYEDHPYIGYVPPMEDKQVLDRFFTVMDAQLAHELPDWRHDAQQVGLLFDTGEARLSDRLIFASIDTMGSVLWFQARTMDDTRLDRYVNAIHIKPHPFWLPMASVRFPGTCLVRSVKDVLLLTAQHIPAVALRPSLDLTLLNTFPGPFFHFLPPRDDGQEGIREQDRSQQLLLQQYCDACGKAYFPILYPDYESFHAWIESESVFPLYEMMARRLSQ